MQDNSKKGRQLAESMAKLAYEKKAEDIVIIDLTEIENSVCNFFVIGTCNSDQHLTSVVQQLSREGKRLGEGRVLAEGMDAKEWALIDYFDVVVHMMLPETRSYYKLEKLWADSTMEILNEKGEFISTSIKEIEDTYVEFDRDEFTAPDLGLDPSFFEFDDDEDEEENWD